MRSVFSVFGYGLGHATRVESIINSLGGDFRVVASDDAFNYFSKRGFNPLRIDSFKVGSFMSGFSWIQTLFENIDFPFNVIADYNKIKRLVNSFNPSVIVSDTEPVSMMVANAFSVSSVFVSNIIPIIYEYKRIPSWLRDSKLDGQESVIRIVVDQALRKNDLLLSPTITRYNAGSSVKFTDLIVRVKPSDLKPVDRIIKEHKLPSDFILVSFGGAVIGGDYYNLLLPLLKEFSDEFFVVSTNHAVRRVVDVGNLRLYPFIDDYLSLLKACKAVITLAGHSTISEALVYGKPLFTIPIDNHVEQLVNAFIVKDKGFGDSFLYKSKIKVNKLRSALKSFISNINEFSVNIRKANFKGLGDVQCAKFIKRLGKA